MRTRRDGCMLMSPPPMRTVGLVGNLLADFHRVADLDEQVGCAEFLDY